MKLLNLLLLKLLIVVGSIFIKAVESIFVEEVDCCRLLCAIESSSFVEAVESVVVEAVDCCRLLYAIESSSFV